MTFENSLVLMRKKIHKTVFDVRFCEVIVMVMQTLIRNSDIP